MPYCIKCGVELDAGMKKCPLCNTAVLLEESSTENFGRTYPDSEIDKVVSEYSSEKKYKKALETVSILLFVPFFIIMSLDIIDSQSFTWSRIPLISLMYMWLICFYPLFFHGNIPIIVVGEMLSVMTFIGLIDFLDDFSFEWFFPIAVPTLVVLFVLMIIISFLTVKSKRKGVNIAGFIIGAIGFFCLLLEMIVSFFIRDNFDLNWSLFVFFPCFILSVAMIYVHYRFENFDLLKKFFDF